MKHAVKRTLCLLLCLLLAAAAGGCGLPESTNEFEGDASPLSVGSPFKHYFERLSVTEKYAYNAVLSEISAFPNRIEIPALTQDELNETYTALLYDNPELFFLTGETILRKTNSRAYLYPNYRMLETDYEAMFRKCSEIASQIAQDARAQSTAFGRERVVHDRLIALCSYTDDTADSYKGTIYGVLCGEKATCEGYAKTAKYLLDLLDVPCYVVHGNSTPPGSHTQSHMWNVVQLDGEWYHLDLTWDDPVPEKGGELICHAYFNVTDDMLRTTHADYDAGCVCSATRNNFFVHEDLLFTDFGDAEKERAAAYAAQVLSLGSDGFQLRFADRQSFADAQRALFDEEDIYPFLRLIRETSGKTFATNRVTYYTTDETYTIEIIPVP